jgi:N-hydroxyarylamine O-acetyltransferase
VTLLSARVARPDGSASPEFDHLTLQVHLPDQLWLADVGFGDSFNDPLRLGTAAKQLQDGRGFRIVESGASFQLEKAEPDGPWQPQYSFTLTRRSLGDFAEMCHYHQTSPESHFTQNRICTKATPLGRVTLAERKVIFMNEGVKNEKPLASEEEWRAALQEHFEIVLK